MSPLTTPLSRRTLPPTPAPAFLSATALPLHTRCPRAILSATSPTRIFTKRPSTRIQLPSWSLPTRPHMVSTRMEDASIRTVPSQEADGSQIPISAFRKALPAVLASLAATVVYLQRGTLASALARLTALAAELGPTRGAALLAAMNFCTVLCCFPANMGLMMGAGAVLGTVPAFVALFVSKTAAAMVAFALAKGVLYDRVKQWLEGYPKMAKVLMESGREGGWKFVLLMRLSPFPGFLLNYLLSLTGVTFAEYALGTLVGIAPSIMNLVLMGSTAKDVGVGVAGGGPRGGWLGLAIKTVCMLSMVLVSVVITKRARRAFADMDQDPRVEEVETHSV